ncbi:MAG: phage holin family protein [Candidatus Omnitrophota bacterium]|nr:phage holin family protein [Candidatus Omnitrophota bacterium]
MRGFLLRWFINSLALLAVTYIIKGIEIANITTVFVAALILGIINAFLRPLITLVTLPINILTWGLFTFIINGFLFYLASKIVKGFSIANFWTAFFGALLYSVISLLLNILINKEGRIEIRYIKEK